MKKQTCNLILLTVALSLFSGCYCRMKRNPEPPYPQNTTGWKYREENGVGIMGEFMLKKGESTNNGKVELKIVDIIPENLCAEPMVDEGKRRVKIQFKRMSDNKLVCEGTFSGRSCSDKELEEFRIFGVGTRGISIKDQWAHIILVTSSE